IFYGEEGETEYGGSTELKNVPFHGIDFMRKVYLEGGQDLVFKEAKLTDEALTFFRFPTEEEIGDNELKITHWSYFENWDPYRNYLVAKEKCGLIEAVDTNLGTFTNFAQNDQALYALHAYMMYLKFGFGRATQDAGIEIRRGAMDREQAINLVRFFDGKYPEQFIDQYLVYYAMTQGEFEAVLDKWVNRDLFEKQNGRWRPNFTIK
ncbi:MAG: N-acetyl sugar amidotransferase, partial [Actinomycetota bacterium]